MKDKKDIVAMLKKYKQIVAAAEGPFETDHQWGVANGLEIALSLIEERPAFYITKDKKYNEYDIRTNPEYFL